MHSIIQRNWLWMIVDYYLVARERFYIRRDISCNCIDCKFLSINNSNALQHSSCMIPPMCLRMQQTSMSTREISVVYRDASRPVTRKSEFSANGLAAGNVYLWSGRIDVVGIVSVSTFSTRAHLRGLLVEY